MLASTPADAAIIALILISLTASLISTQAPARAVDREPGAARPSPRPLPAALVWFIAGGALLQGSHATVYGFGSIEWRAQGISESVIGWLWAIGVIAEVVLFWVIGRGVGRGADSRMLMLIGAIAALIRFAGLALAPGVAITFMLQTLHGLTFGATHLGMMAALTRLAPQGSRGKAQGLFSAGMALVTAAGMVISGWVYPHLGAATYLLMLPIALAGGACVLAGTARMRG
jgi:PPP family 3-phenylpropionic acid transporter